MTLSSWWFPSAPAVTEEAVCRGGEALALWASLLINSFYFPNRSLQSLSLSFSIIPAPPRAPHPSLICIQVASSPPCVWLCRAGVHGCGSDNDSPLISCLAQTDRSAETLCFPLMRMTCFQLVFCSYGRSFECREHKLANPHGWFALYACPYYHV